MHSILDKNRLRPTQTALSLWEDEGGAIEKMSNMDICARHSGAEGSRDKDSAISKPPSEIDKDMETKNSTTCTAAQMMDRSEEGSPKETSDQPLTTPNEERGFFSRSSSWA